jgi:hypothetical protein
VCPSMDAEPAPSTLVVERSEPTVFGKKLLAAI